MKNIFNEIVIAFSNEDDVKVKLLCDEIYLEMCNSPMICLSTIFKKSGYTKNELIDITGIGERTIEDYLYCSHKNYQKKVLIRFLLSLNIPPNISGHVLRVCGFSFNFASEFDIAVSYVIQNRWYKPLEENLNLLRKFNIYI